MADVFKKLVIEFIRDTKTFARILKKLKIITLENGKCLAELKVNESHANNLAGLHGGLSATLVDNVSTYALQTHPKVGYEAKTVSVEIHTIYLKGAKIGDVIEIDAKTIRAGKTMAFLDVDIKNKATGDLLVKGSHIKYILRPK